MANLGQTRCQEEGFAVLFVFVSAGGGRRSIEDEVSQNGPSIDGNVSPKGWHIECINVLFVDEELCGFRVHVPGKDCGSTHHIAVF
jgi:hypothetical protein